MAGGHKLAFINNRQKIEWQEEQHANIKRYSSTANMVDLELVKCSRAKSDRHIPISPAGTRRLSKVFGKRSVH